MSLVRSIPFAIVLSGCGLIAGLRTDYEVSESGTEASTGADGAADGASMSDVTGDGNPCSDMMKDGLETDVDCGGGMCPKCTNNKACKMNSDCQSDNCSNNRCRP